MSDDTDGEGDDPAERASRFVDAYGVSEVDYSETVRVAIDHALAPGRPNFAAPPWVNIGPRNVAGRILSIAQDPKNPLVVWAGSAHGGLWRTIDGGDTWEHVGTPKESFPVATIAIPADDPTTVYVGTGSVISGYPGGAGLFKVSAPAPTQPASFNYPPLAAAPPPTVSPAAAANGSATHYARIRMDPYDSRRLWVASMTGLWRYESFAATPFTREFPPAAALAFATPPLSAGPVPPPGTFNGWPNYACDVLVSRDPTNRDTEAGKPRFLFVYVAVNGQGVFRGRFDRHDGSLTWQKQLGPFPGQPATFGRITLAQCRNFPENVYAVFEDTNNANASAVQWSSDSGDNWTNRTAIPAAAQGQADYDLVLEVNPDHPGKLFCGAVELCYSEDTGNTWSQLTVFGFYDGGDHANHSDHHALVFDGLDRTRVWSGNDGGLVLADDIRSVPRPRFWRHRSHGIVAGQFNSIDVNPRFPFITGGGLQDNGSWVGFGGPTWMRSGGGDGGQTSFNSGNPRQWVITWQNHADAASVILNVPSVSPAFLPPGLRARVNPTMPDLPIGVMEERKDGYPIPNPPNHPGAPFVPRIVEHPGTPGLVLATGSTNGGSLAYWLSPAPQAPPQGTPLPPPALAATPVGLPGGLALMNNAETSAVAFAPLINGATDAWIGSNDGQLLLAVNAVGVPTPFALTAALPQPGGIRQVISDIAVHPSDPRTLAVAAIPNAHNTVIVSFAGPGAPGAAQAAGIVTFNYSIGGRLFGAGGVGGAPIVTRAGAGMILVGTTLVLTFSAANTFLVADTFSIDALGNVTPGGGGSTGNLTAASTQGATVTIAVATAGAFPGPATFNMSIGGATFNGNPIAMGARVSLPGTFVEVFFPNGNYVAGSSWTINPQGTVTSTGAGGSPLPSAVVNPGGRVYMTWDRGATWSDISFPSNPLPRPSPDIAALPPAPVASLIWNPTATPTSAMIAGTLVGVYATSGIPAPAVGGLTFNPPGPISIRAGAANALQMRASLAMTSGGTIDVTSQVDWSVPGGAHVTVTPGGLVTGVTVGATVVTARRGVLSATITVTVAAGAPATPAPAAAAPLIAPAVNAGWQPMNQAIPPNPNNEGLPLVLINDITTIGTRVRVATFGRGVWEAELVPAQQQQHRLYIRQTAVEDGVTYPRVIPVVGVPSPPPLVGGPAPAAPTLGTDPRVPLGPWPPPPPPPVVPVAPTVTLDFTHGFDIRVDTAPFRFFDDRIDGVELEQQVGVGLGAPTLPPKRPLTATEKAVVYVQVLNSGFDKVDDVDVHLYYFQLAAPIAGGLFPPAGVPLPALNPVTDFYNPPGFNPPSPPDPTKWRRVAPSRHLARAAPTGPAVARFEWQPEAALGGQDVALLAICTSANDPLPAAPVGGGAVAAFLAQERRAALRIVSVGAAPAASVFIRDGVDDDGRNAAVAFASRSPDIIVVQSPPVAPATPEQAFADLLDLRPQARLKGGVTNTIYVRVHNRSVTASDAQIELWAIPVVANNQPNLTSVAAAPWVLLWPPAGPPPAPLHVPARGWALQPVTWTNPPDPFAAAPAASKAWILFALVSAGAGDPKPDVTLISTLAGDVDTLWRFLGRERDSENAAARALRYDPA